MDRLIEEKNYKKSRFLINEYWRDFKEGVTWNYYLWKPKYIEGDVWASKNQWVMAAKECIDKNINVIQALEVLLYECYDEYCDFAERFIARWHEVDGHDDYIYYDILAKLPKENSVRKNLLSINSFHDIYGDGSEASLARKALVNARDEEFIGLAGIHLNNILSAGDLDGDVIEDRVIPILLDLGFLSNECVSDENMDKVKSLCLYYYEKDRAIMDDVLNGKELDDDERQLWVADNIAYISWVLSWGDVLDSLNTDKLYWAGMFSDIWSDHENYNLLAWSFCESNEALKKQAEIVMYNHEYHRLDGAIAWTRLDKIER